MYTHINQNNIYKHGINIFFTKKTTRNKNKEGKRTRPMNIDISIDVWKTRKVHINKRDQHKSFKPTNCSGDATFSANNVDTTRTPDGTFEYFYVTSI